MARALALLAAAAALAAAAWWQIADGPFELVPVGRVLALGLAPSLVVLALRAFVPAIRRPWLAGAALFVPALFAAAGYALGVPVTHMRRGELDFFGPLFDAVGHGFGDFYETRVPFVPAEHAEMTGLVLMAIYLTVALSGLLVAAGRPLAAGFALVCGVGWPATLAATIPGARPLRAGAVIFAAVLLFLLLTRERRRPLRRLGPAVALGTLLVLAAVGASTSGAVAKGAFLSWQAWNYEPEPERVGVRYVWSSNYTGIKFPEEPTVVLRIKAPERKLYWRATTLDEYTGVGWREDLQTGPPVLARRVATPSDEALVPEAAFDQKDWIRQEVTVEALADTHVVGASVPMRVDLREPLSAQYSPGGVVLLSRGLDYRQRYTVWSYVPRVEPEALTKLSAGYPTELQRYLEVVPGVRFPAFGAPSRPQLVRLLFEERSFDGLLAEYEPLYEEARAVVEGAKTPYVAVAALEAWFRSEGGFVYDETPPPYGADPPLVTFVLEHKVGYCQQYAGAMALMLRLLGIPARVAAGFTSGEYDERRGEWVVSDHNAHTWVEVWFPQYGWLPFDPTPGRGTLGGSYSTSSAAFGRGGDFPRALGGTTPAALQALLAQRQVGAGLRGTRGTPAAPSGPGSGAVASPGGEGASIAGLVFAVLGSVLALLLGVKEARRRLRFAGRDPRRLAAACRRDLVAFLADQRVAVSPSATLEDLGRFLEQRYRVNATPFVRAAALARFGPPAEAEDAARRARRELRELLRQLRRQLTATGRARGAMSFRSLAV